MTARPGAGKVILLFSYDMRLVDLTSFLEYKVRKHKWYWIAAMVGDIDSVIIIKITNSFLLLFKINFFYNR